MVVVAEGGLDLGFAEGRVLVWVGMTSFFQEEFRERI